MEARSLRLALGACWLAAAVGRAASADPLHGYTGETAYYSIPYANDPGFGTTTPSDPAIALTIGGTPFTIHLDTGSRALYVDVASLPANTTLDGPAGYVYLNSSGRIFQGTWTNQTVTFPQAVGSGGATGTATATLPVLVVQGLTASATPPPGTTTAQTTFSTLVPTGAVNLVGGGTVPIVNGVITLTPGQVAAYADNPGVLAPVANFGVGFDRTGFGTSPLQNDYNQQYNAFLNLTQMQAGTMRAGYILTAAGVQLGLTQATTGFAYTDLLPTGLTNIATAPPDWQPPMGTLVYNGVTYGTGQVVVDIGIPHGILTLPGQPTSGSNLTLPMTVNLLNSGGGVSYEINANPANLLNPTNGEPDALMSPDISWFAPLAGQFSENAPPYAGQFFNTGRNVLSAFDLVYDAEAGFFGLKPNGTAVPSANLTFTAAYYPVPEPAAPAWALAGLGAVLLWRRGRRRDAASATGM